MTSGPPVLWHIEGRVGHIVLNRREAANALNTAMGQALGAAIDALLGAPVGAILISSRGKQFCAGGDINEFVERRADLDRLVGEMLDALHPQIHRLATAPLPVVSAVQGPVGGAGISVALCADIVLAAPEMKLRCGYSAIGLSPDLGASYYLTRRAGAARAKNLLMTNRAIAAQQCLDWGIVDELHSADALMASATALATQLAEGATASFAAIKKLCDSAHEHDLLDHLALERAALERCAASPQAREGVAAFIERRPPRF